MLASVALSLLCQITPVSTDASAEREAMLVDGALRKEIERAAADGLRWLQAAQSPRGYWQGDVGHKQEDNYLVLESARANEARGEGHPGVTALCGLAFLAGGHLPGRGPYGDTIQRGLEYTLDHVQENGYITDGGSRMYSHAFATLFLAEVYGMSGGKRTRHALERATHIIVDCQNRHGAWRYNPFTERADLSVTVCQLQSLRAARNIGIQVPKTTIDAAARYVQASRTPRGRNAGLYYYKIHGRSAYRKNREFAINAAAVTALFSAGVYDDELVADALDFLEEDYVDIARYYPTHFYFWYGNYYACQAFFQAGGKRFARYYRRLVRDLLRSQQADGRWLNRTGPGDAFATGVACLLLQLPKQYLPIFQR